MTDVGTGSGSESNKGNIYVQLFSRKERSDLNVIMEDVRQILSSFRDVTMTFMTFGSKDVEMVLNGAQTETLIGIAGHIIADMKATGKMRDIETDVRLDKPQLNVKLDRGMTDAMNVDVRSLSTEIQAYFGGVKAGVYKEGGRPTPTIFTALSPARGS